MTHTFDRVKDEVRTILSLGKKVNPIVITQIKEGVHTHKVALGSTQGIQLSLLEFLQLPPL